MQTARTDVTFSSLTSGCRAAGVSGAAAVEGASSAAGGPPAAIPGGGIPSSRFVTTPFLVDCILICCGLEFIGELLVVWSNCKLQKERLKSALKWLSQSGKVQCCFLTKHLQRIDTNSLQEQNAAVQRNLGPWAALKNPYWVERVTRLR